MGKNTVLRSGCYIRGPVIIGNDCDIGPNVCILPSTSVGNNVNIDSAVRLKNCLIGNGVTIGANSDLESSVIDNDCHIKGHLYSPADMADLKIEGTLHNVNTGSMIGESCYINFGVSILPGTLIGSNCKINAMKVVSGWIQNDSRVI